MTIPSDLSIAQSAKLLRIDKIAEQMGLEPERDLEHYGPHVAKIKLEALERLRARPDAKYVDVTAITPTPLGEGKSTTTVGIGQAMKHIGKRAVITVRQPSQGPTFGIKGGAAGGGYSQIVPMENFNLHLTGDIHAISAAHNLIAAMLDAHIYHGNERDIDIHNIPWRRVVDLNDRALRNVIIGLGKRFDGVPRQSGYDITVASELMAILALTTSLQDMRARIGKMVVAYDRAKQPVTAEDIRAAGAATVLMKDAIKPNLMQTLEGSPALVHAGPFANIAHGNSSIIADLVAMKCGDYVITESGFGADIGAEKFFNIKARIGGLKPNAVVLVATIRALKAHTGKYRIIPGKPIDAGLREENVADVEAGAVNMVRHLENLRKFGVNPVVAINVFTDDSPREIEAVREIALANGAVGASVAKHWAQGGAGAAELAEMIVSACDSPNDFRLLYPDDMALTDKIETIAREIYRADGVDYAPIASRKLRQYEAQGLRKLPICMAKTHLSLSDDPKLKGAPDGFRISITDVRASAGAGFIYPLCGDVRTMPGLGRMPAAMNVDIDADGKVVGLF
ncbi:MAG: formate--tetrahydrofolate ligase [Chloroflexi bacterium]|nr:formate--tetrahydrofolate ligase [Chloroflexota bacterium]MCY3581555.1 formate--tetrahydrofolate ligase [Chloroflexota bacterium]MCY3717661.1 formate--tetrahydrofolate ligase [Chloroflexota bacterium]MDE2649758.1 formate--tetrahydrofolate ligase [Chloroflexota bacterium]MXX49967.1 formate--tetrahydrofolate ligase [Chloroflexota bacterium]